MIAPAQDDSPQAHFHRMRQWVQAELHAGHPIRQAHYRMAISTAVHRLIKYGPDQILNLYTARDLLNLLPYINGNIAEYLMRTAFSRALIENDDLVIDKLANCIFFPECRAWYWKLVEAICGKAPNPEEVTTWVEGMQGEELSVARLMIARVYPDTVHSSWLHDLPIIPRLQAEVCQLLSLKKDYRQIVQNYLREHPAAKYCVPQAYWERL